MKKNDDISRVITVKHNCFHLLPYTCEDTVNRVTISIATVEKTIEVYDESNKLLCTFNEPEGGELFEENGFYKEFFSTVFDSEIRETFDASFSVSNCFESKSLYDRLIFVPLSEVGLSKRFYLSTKIANKYSQTGPAFYSAITKNALLLKREEYDTFIKQIPNHDVMMEELPLDEVYLVLWNCVNNDFRLCAMQLSSRSADGAEMINLLVPYLYNAEWTRSLISDFDESELLTDVCYSQIGHNRYNFRLLELLGLNRIGPATKLRLDHKVASLDWSNVERILRSSGDYIGAMAKFNDDD